MSHNKPTSSVMPSPRATNAESGRWRSRVLSARSRARFAYAQRRACSWFGRQPTTAAKGIIDKIAMEMMPEAEKAAEEAAENAEKKAAKGAAEHGLTPSGQPAREAAPYAPPNEVRGFSDHAQQQIAGRDGHGVSDAAVKDAVDNPVKTPQFRPDQCGGSYRYTGKDAVVNVNKGGQVTTAWAKSRAGWRNP